jgi:hypothetical protein
MTQDLIVETTGLRRPYTIREVVSPSRRPA